MSRSPRQSIWLKAVITGTTAGTVVSLTMAPAATASHKDVTNGPTGCIVLRIGRP